MSHDQNEEWRDIAGYEGIYQISSLGRVRSLDRRVLCATGHARFYKSRIRVNCPQISGHLQVSLSDSSGVHKRHSVHRLVLNAFIGPCPEGSEACHNNGDPTDNAVTNLRWDTHSSNLEDKKKHGTHLAGELHPCSKLKAADVLHIRERAAAGAMQTLLAKEFGVAQNTVSQIVTRKLWSHV